MSRTRKKKSTPKAASVSPGRQVADAPALVERFDVGSDGINRVETTTIDAIRFMEHASGAFRAATTDLQLRASEMAEENTVAMFDFWRQVIALNDISTLSDIHREFARRQGSAFVRQSLEIARLAMKAATLLPGELPGLKSPGLSD